MEEHQLWITVIVNRLLGKPAVALLALLRIHPENQAAPIPNHIAMELVVFAIAIVFFLSLKRRLSVDRPGAIQQCMELLITNPLSLGVRDMLESFVGHGSERYIAMLGSIGFFVLLCNLISVVPGFESPTSQVSVPLGCAVTVFLYYQWCGFRKHGPLGYGRQFLGPVLAVSPLMVIVEVFSHLARLLSLTVRLWVNMMVSELLYVTFLSLNLALFFFTKAWSPHAHLVLVQFLLVVLRFLALPTTLAALFVVPPLFIILHIFVAAVQAFVFTILPIIYVGGAVAEHH